MRPDALEIRPSHECPGVCPGESIIQRMLGHGFSLSIVNGRVLVEAENGSPTPSKWIKQHEDEICESIAMRMGLPIYRYVSYSTGRYHGGTADGVCLQFEEVGSDRSPYVIFNASLKRDRNTKHGRAGDPLPDGHFKPRKRGKFLRFWKRCGLRLPRRLSAFHDYMGKLTPILFTGCLIKGERLNKDELHPLHVAHQEILRAFACVELTANIRTDAGHVTNNSRTTFPDNKPRKNQGNHEDAGFSAAGKKSYGDAVIRVKATREDTYSTGFTSKDHPVDPRNQSVEEWLADYESTEARQVLETD